MPVDVDGVIRNLLPNEVFVFGSNLAGKHGKGAAKQARRKFGAVVGRAEGLMGKCYAIPTKDRSIRTLTLDGIQSGIERFLKFAKEHQEIRFLVTRIGCGLAGYPDSRIAPMFRDAPDNVILPVEWDEIVLRGFGRPAGEEDFE